MISTMESRGPGGCEETIGRRFHLRTKAGVRSCNAMAKAVIRLISEDVRDEDFLYDMRLAVYEACTNVTRHAYPEDDPGEMLITVTIQPRQYVSVEVVDWGAGFACWPVRVTVPRPSASGGRGLLLMSKLTDAFEVRRVGGRNVVFCKKNISEELWKSCA